MPTGLQDDFPGGSGITGTPVDPGSTGGSLVDLATETTGTLPASKIGPHAASHKHGGTDPVAVAAAAANAIPKADGTGKLDAAWLPPTAPAAHAVSHLPSGSDPLTTAAANTLSVGSAAATGSAESFSRSDHNHAVTAPAAPADVTKAAASAGTATTPARADHKHDVTTAAAVANPPGSVNTEGTSTSLSRADHVHALAAFGSSAATFCEGNDARLSDARTPTAHATSHKNGGTDEVAVAAAAANAIPKAGAGGLLDRDWIPSRHVFMADMLDTPNTSNWAVNAHAPAVADSVNSGLTVRRFDDTAEEGVGFSLPVPVKATSLRLTFRSRGQTAPGAARTVGLKLYFREIPDNAAVAAWSAGLALTDIDIPTNANFQLDSQSITLATLGLTADRMYQFELTRVNPTAGTELVGDWDLLSLRAEFI